MKSNISHCLFMLVLGARCTQLSISWRKIINLVAGLGLVWAHTTGSLRLGADMEAMLPCLQHHWFGCQRSTFHNTDRKKEGIPILGKDKRQLVNMQVTWFWFLKCETTDRHFPQEEDASMHLLWGSMYCVLSIQDIVKHGLHVCGHHNIMCSVQRAAASSDPLLRWMQYKVWRHSRHRDIELYADPASCLVTRPSLGI